MSLDRTGHGAGRKAGSLPRAVDRNRSRISRGFRLSGKRARSTGARGRMPSTRAASPGCADDLQAGTIDGSSDARDSGRRSSSQPTRRSRRSISSRQRPPRRRSASRWSRPGSTVLSSATTRKCRASSDSTTTGQAAGAAFIVTRVCAPPPTPLPCLNGCAIRRGKGMPRPEAPGAPGDFPPRGSPEPCAAKRA